MLDAFVFPSRIDHADHISTRELGRWDDDGPDETQLTLYVRILPEGSCGSGVVAAIAIDVRRENESIYGKVADIRDLAGARVAPEPEPRVDSCSLGKSRTEDRKSEAVNSAERFGPESLPELGVALSKVFLVFRKGLSGRPRPSQAGLRLGMVAHVAFAALLFEDFSCDIVDLFELPYTPGTGLRIQLRQTVGIGQRSLIDGASP
jgi:hypothetical protein